MGISSWLVVIGEGAEGAGLGVALGSVIFSRGDIETRKKKGAWWDMVATVSVFNHLDEATPGPA
jgi:hypothetical protein